MNLKNNVRKLMYLGLSPFSILNYELKGYAVLMYHRIVEDKLWNSDLTPQLSVKLSDFDKQISFITKRFKVISLTEIVDRITNSIPLDRLFVSISFDDGYADNYILGGSILKKYNVKATIFVAAGYIENNQEFPYWDELKQYATAINDTIICKDINGKTRRFQLNSLKGKKEFVSTVLKWYHKKSGVFIKLLAELKNKSSVFNKSVNSFFRWELLKEAIASGNYEVGSHTMTHPLLNLLEDNGKEEIYKSKSLIENRLQTPVELFSFPFGGSHVTNTKVLAVIKECCFKGAFTNNIGINSERENVFLLKRIPVLGGEKIWELNSKLYGAEWLERMYLLKSNI